MRDISYFLFVRFIGSFVYISVGKPIHIEPTLLKYVETFWPTVAKRIKCRRLDVKVVGSNPSTAGRLTHLAALC